MHVSILCMLMTSALVLVGLWCMLVYGFCECMVYVICFTDAMVLVGV